MTLTELLIMLVILVTLGMVALPTYFDFQQRARRTDAKQALEQAATLQERFYLNNFSYTANPAEIGFEDNVSRQGLYAISVPAADDAGFLVVAVPAPGSSQLRDADCQQFSIDNEGVRGAAPDPDGNCW